jgi:t-SNARE complex subunit (syntaxin)
MNCFHLKDSRVSWASKQKAISKESDCLAYSSTWKTEAVHSSETLGQDQIIIFFLHFIIIIIIIIIITTSTILGITTQAVYL